MIPMKQTVTIRRKGTPDRWGEAEVTEFTLKCRVVEGTKLTRRTLAQPNATAVSGEEVVSTATIQFDKLADVKLTDEIVYTDEAGVTYAYQPLNIKRIRGLNGKTLFTEVEV